MNRHILFVFLMLTLFLFGCAQPISPETPEAPGETGYTLQWLASLKPDTILIQYSTEPTFFRMEAMYPFGRVPPFTLYADGTVIYIDEGQTFEQQQVLMGRLSQDQTLALVRDFMKLGFEGLEDYLDFCAPQDDGTEVCIADDAYTIFSATLLNGEYRSVKSYSTFSNDPNAVAQIRSLLNSFTADGAEPYEPQKATLFVTDLVSTLDRFEFIWPLDPSLLTADRNEMTALVLEGQNLRLLLDTVGRNTGDFYFEVEGNGYVVYLGPWLPTDDYAAAIEAEFPSKSTSSLETPMPVEEPIFVISAAAREDLAKRLNIDPESITVFEVEEVDWSNGCLGIVMKDTACTEAIVPGFRLLLDASGVTYEYRSDREGSLILPADPRIDSSIELPEAIQIASPGPGSRIVSPLFITGMADPTFEQNLVVRILLADGTLLAEQPVTIQADTGQRGPYSAEIPFTVDGEQQGFIQVFTTSARDGGITHLNSVGVLLASDGSADIRPEAGNGERIRIDRPANGETIRSGIVQVIGFALASFEQTLVIDILDENGEVIETMPVIVQAPDLGFPGVFSADITFLVYTEGAGRIVVRDPSAAFAGDVHIASVEVRLVP